MANQNLFEKYGIKEVADVTLYRIEKKEETFESQRKIAASSILKGALELRDVYPVDENGMGDEEGFKAYVFTDAQVITGTNYDCDDVRKITVTLKLKIKNENNGTNQNATLLFKGLEPKLKANASKLVEAAVNGDKEYTGVDAELAEVIENLAFVTGRDTDTGVVVSETILADYATITLADESGIKYTYTTDATAGGEIEYINITLAAPFEVTLDIDGMDQTETGIYNSDTSAEPDAFYTDRPGTHEYSYAQQICMLYARRQNLMAKTGVRYVFENADTMFGDIDFNTQFAAAPYSTQKVVVVGLAGKFDEGVYDIDEINEAIAKLTDSIIAKAYDVTYVDYAELVVEDEMGYYNPAFLGTNYRRIPGGKAEIDFFGEGGYIDYAGENVDFAIARAKMWSDGVHYSINDAIDALRQKKLILDAGEANGAEGINSIFGGYLVSSYEEGTTTPEPGKADNDYEDNTYKYRIGEENEQGDTELIEINSDITGEPISSDYRLAEVKKAVADIGATNEAFGKDLRVDANGKPSNRAIYIRVDGAVDTSAGAYIYLLRNKNAKKLALDKDGIFKFTDKEGNVLYYQDKIFCGVEYLALVILGDKGLIFVVNRHGNKNVTRTGWMVSDNGFVTDKQADTLVKNGLIHTTDITVNDETFEATCTVGGMKTHKTKKFANRYVPVLFLDTLKVSTLEQTAEEVYATGGKGNANLIGWDYNKEITLSLQDALFSPASMSAIFGSYEGSDFRKGVKEAKSIDRMEKVTAKRSFIVPAGNQNGTPSEADKTAQAVFYDPHTMEPYADGTPIAEGEIFYKYTRSIAYEGQSIGNMIEISADKFPGTYKIVGETYIRNKGTGEDQRFQFIVPQAKMTSEQSITLEADGEPSVFDLNMTVLRPEDGIMVRLVQYDVVENEEENDGSTMVKNTENLNLLDDAELYKVNSEGTEEQAFIGATEY